MGVPKTSDGKQIFSLWPTEGTRKTFITGNWCDKTTWYQLAIRIVDEVAVCINSPSYTQYAINNNCIIDTYHGKISQEDFLTDIDGNHFRVIVKVNNIEKIEQDPHYGTGGDYTVDYVSGIINFFLGLQPEDVVEVTYYCQNGSEYVIKPELGKKLKIKSAEVQFTKDIVITDSIKFQLYGFVDVFAPQLMPGVPSGTLIPLGNPVIYKTLMDYINEANGAYPEISAMGGTSWRGMAVSTVTFPWNYQAVTELKSSAGMEIRIKLEHDSAFIGTAATAAFYCLSEDE
jgi:hypothetical protein